MYTCGKTLQIYLRDVKNWDRSYNSQYKKRNSVQNAGVQLYNVCFYKSERIWEQVGQTALHEFTYRAHYTNRFKHAQY
jgi:hypothetical protein